MTRPSLFRRLFLCPTGMCQTFRQGSDDTGVWGECSVCGKRVGFVSREELRRYAGAIFISDEWPATPPPLSNTEETK